MDRRTPNPTAHVTKLQSIGAWNSNFVTCGELRQPAAGPEGVAGRR
jgi:hypothetical protein